MPHWAAPKTQILHKKCHRTINLGEEVYGWGYDYDGGMGPFYGSLQNVYYTEFYEEEDSPKVVPEE